MQNETPAPFAPFVPPGEAPPTQPEKPARKRAAKSSKPQAPAEPTRTAKPRRKAAKTRAAKYDLQTILRVANSLKEADQPVFEKLLGELSALPKAQAERVLKALAEVFG